ncbi:hydantoinase/oxoprolinase family protein [Desulforhabdus amnigena]|jgi:N-methylhydantoinase A/oxoprolinase/acetone carboxylase beta subunit|uniref:Hydantoinase/oxoprolinase n=1 Tax=Desulforhabdus amnigena TaxID=40218 RepID=A0A9W6CXE0_9BACT|nr:hydantoinase/oxoprolinase family protein [Desulforhabdus amnigena]NLJ29353.1 hydantoinase/oxoprolinase family protein [Deltaproteobacteria bacterium]GLI34379.1 hydantoinase/oxoprolinase [Desulforhabdus amnigena]
MIIGLDVGGTHTDVVLIGEGCILRQTKVPTDPSNLFGSVWTALDEVTRDVPPETIRRAVLSTTLTTNAIAEGKLEETGMIVSAGPGIDPECFRTNKHYYTVSGSIDHRGREIQSIDSMEIEAIASLLRSEGIRHVGVVGKFSVRNPKHEILIREILGDDFENVVLGHRLSGNLSFPRRIATTYLNASVYAIHKKFFQAVKDSLQKKGLHIPIFILKADGGTMSLEASLNSPGQTILSGPAASVMGSLPFASETEETLVLDIGGTTTDMAILIRRVPLLDPLGCELGGYKTLIRSLKTRSIGLGGDSTVRVVNGELTIGPDRQGRAMAYGGPVPTTTDALFVLGKATNGDVEAAKKGIESLARQQGTSIEETANQIFDLACNKILEEAARMIDDINSKPVYTVQELLEGYQVKPKEILVLGGPAPYFAFRLAAMTEFEVHVVPQWHVANAIGAALAKNTCEVTLFADTERGIAIAPEEDFYQQVKKDFDHQKAVNLAFELLKNKCLQEGASESEVEVEVLEDIQFNMVRDFYTTGKNIRVKVQIKPGLIPEFRDMAEKLFNFCPLPGTI